MEKIVKYLAVLMVALFAACTQPMAEDDWVPPPYKVYPKKGEWQNVVKDTRESVEDWNAKLRPYLGYDVFEFHEEGEPDPNDCGTIVVGFGGILNNEACHKVNGQDCQGTADLRDKCHMSINLSDNGFWNSTIRHELGHTLGLPDLAPGTKGPRADSIMVQGEIFREITPGDVQWVLEIFESKDNQ